MPVRRLKSVDWGDDVADIQNNAGNPLFKKVTSNWTKPTIWKKDMKHPEFDDSDPFIYALFRNHGNSKTKDHIEYIGITKAPQSRFENHRTAKDIVDQRGTVGFSYATLDFVVGRNKGFHIVEALQEIEHLIIWALWGQGVELRNVKKQYTLPGLGKNGGNAWDIQNKGYRFSGRMPFRLVYPWMLICPGRDATRKLKT